MIARIVQICIGLLNNQATRLFLMKVFIKTIIVVVVPYAVFIAFNELFRSFVDFQVNTLSNLDVEYGGTAIQLSGLGAYLWNQLGIGVGLSMLVSAHGIVLMGKSIPFLR